MRLRRYTGASSQRRTMPEVKGRADRMFLAWFGPVGVAAIYCAMLAPKHGRSDLVWQVTSAVICASALAHGLSATPSTQGYRDPVAQPDRAGAVARQV